MKKFTIFLLIVFTSSGYSLKVGLDSGHSIKELYKSGGAFNIQRKNTHTGEIETKSYYSVAWPAGGVRMERQKVKNGHTYWGKEFQMGGVQGTYVMMTNSVDIGDWEHKTHKIAGVTKDWQDVRVLRGQVKKINMPRVNNIWVIFPNYNSNKPDNPFWKDIKNSVKKDLGKPATAIAMFSKTITPSISKITVNYKNRGGFTVSYWGKDSGGVPVRKTQKYNFVIVKIKESDEDVQIAVGIVREGNFGSGVIDKNNKKLIYTSSGAVVPKKMESDIKG